MPRHLLLVPLALLAASAIAGDAPAYREEVEAWRRKRADGLKAEDGWLSVAGLYWLKPGETTLGADAANDIVLPDGAPPSLGTVELRSDGGAAFRAASGVGATLNGKPVQTCELRSDADGAKADVLAFGRMKLILLKRGSRHALRLKDNDARTRADFHGLNWFPIVEKWRLEAAYTPDPTPRPVVFETIVGEPDVARSAGTVSFEVDGKPCSLQAVDSGGQLWFVFRDATAGKQTAAGARQLTAERPAQLGDPVILDFNKAANLPCAYIIHATCPLAPPQNRLKVAIPAGEQLYGPQR